jgi:hypothetical protein
VPFVGSGVSLSIKRGLFPTWSELLGDLAQRLDAQSKPDHAELVRLLCKVGKLYQAADNAVSALGKAQFHAVMRKRFQTAKPDDGDLSLPEAIWRLRPAIVVTTNYEDVLGWACPHAERIMNDQPAELAELYRSASPERPRVWHLHGHHKQTWSPPSLLGGTGDSALSPTHQRPKHGRSSLHSRQLP